MLYNYSITTLSGGASGMLGAESEEELKEILDDVYVIDFQNEDGETVKNEIVELNITEVGEA